MEMLGFILGAAVLVYLTFCIGALPFVSLLGGGLQGIQWLYWSFGAIFVLVLWYALFSNAPFTITVTS